MDYVIGDFHIGSVGIMQSYHRPFKSVDEMYNAFVNNWNTTLEDNDTGWILGDIGDPKILHELRGKLNIIVGNHDNYEALKAEFKDLFISPYPIMHEGVWYSHEPITFMPPESPYSTMQGIIGTSASTAVSSSV